MEDYWSKLKLNECWSKKQRFNILMNHIFNSDEVASKEQQTVTDTTDTVDVSTIHVSVIDEDTGDGVNNASVEVHDDEHSYNGTTGKAGGCNITNVPYGEYTLFVEAEGYESNVDSLTVTGESMDVTVNLTPSSIGAETLDEEDGTW